MRKLALMFASIIIAVAGCQLQPDTPRSLPYLGNHEVVYDKKNGQKTADTIFQTIPAFKFVNQYGDSITEKNLNGKIYVADFFFTSCPSICPTMHRNMLKVYNEFKNVSDFKILSHSIDPKYDSVAVMKKYADKLGVSGQSWWFLQGKKDETYKLAANYLTAVAEDSSAPGGHTHDGWFILVDKQKRIRGNYNGVDPTEVTKLIADIKILQAEPDQSIAQ